MASLSSYPLTWRFAFVAMLLAASGVQSARAADDATEREQLTALARQLQLLDRLAEHTADAAPQERARYHFDYGRLRADLKRVRDGVHDYLAPPRAQPRDPVPLAGVYVRSSADTDPQEATAP